MNRAIRLRRWQRRALDLLEERAEKDFLAVATPGAGKTTFALTALRRHFANSHQAPIVIVAPTAHLKTQWVVAGAQFGFAFDSEWTPARGSLPDDMHGVVTTYQQVAGSPGTFAKLARNGLVILDEIHHAGDERAWGRGILEAFRDANWRLAISGTPFRSDNHAIPFVRYALDEAMPDFEYSYGDALADGNVIRHIEFPSLNGDMEWITPDGSHQRASFRDALDPTLAAQRLRTALSPTGDWLPAVIDAAHRRLIDVRRDLPDAGGLVIATDQEHARSIGQLLAERHGVRAIVATSDDDHASQRIARFASSRDPWLIAVRMVSEGVDIPRLAVGVFATTTTTELFFRQAVGRFVRQRPSDNGLRACLYIPDDPRLRTRAAEIARVRRHHLILNGNRVTSDRAANASVVAEEEQLSLFAPLSATPLGEAHVASTAPPTGISTADDDPELLCDLPPLPVRAANTVDRGDVTPTTAGSRRRNLRRLNAARAADLVRFAKMPHARVNAELNRMAGISRIDEASEDDLEKRLAAAERWLRS